MRDDADEKVRAKASEIVGRWRAQTLQASDG
jgi:hypothetical protein